MRTSDDLFFLIKSLTPAEKRYFKRFSTIYSGNKDNNYLRLFEVINKQKEYDEEAIKRKFKKEAFIKQLTFTKNTLNNKILKSLRSFHEGGKNTTIPFQLREALDEIMFLFEKGLFNQLGKNLKRAKKTAYKYEAFTDLLKLLDWETKLVKKVVDKNVKEQLQSIEAEERLVLEKIQNKKTYKDINNEIFAELKVKVGTRTVEEVAYFTKLIDTPLLENEDRALSLEAKLLYNEILGYYYWRVTDFTLMFTHYKRIYDLWESHEILYKQRPREYKNILCNFLNACYQAQKLDYYPIILKKLRSLAKQRKVDKKDVFKSTCYHELLFYIAKCEFREGIKAIPLISKELDEIKENIHPSRLITVYYNISIIYFFSANFSASLTWIDHILGHPKVEARQDVQQIAKILQLIIHYELDNVDILDNLYRSTYRYLKQDQSVLEKTILKYLRKLIIINPLDKEEVQASLQEFKQELLAILEQVNRTLVFSTVWVWLEAKIQEKPLDKMLKELTTESTTTATK